MSELDIDVDETRIPASVAEPDDMPTRINPNSAPHPMPQPGVPSPRPVQRVPTPQPPATPGAPRRRISSEYSSPTGSLVNHTPSGGIRLGHTPSGGIRVSHTPSGGLSIGSPAGGAALPSVPLGRGTELGRYVVLEHLGSGGLGDVFTAWDPELDRKVALKLLKSSAYGRVDLSRLHGRLLREAQAMARLSHPNVVIVHDVGLSDSRIFIAMEFVDGHTLKDWVKEKQRPWKVIRDALLQAGEGLIAAHNAGLVHRDFKPSNVLVDHEGRVRVLDFGLARRPTDERNSIDEAMEISDPGTSGRALIDESITQTGTVLGTPAYMAPEQYSQEMVDNLADQFAFCVTAFEAFYGQRPFQGKGEDLVQAILQGQITWPKDQGKIPKFMRKAILRGLSVDPSQRFPSMRDLLKAMQADRRSKRTMFAALGFSVLLSGGGGAAAYAFLQPPPPETDQRVDNLVNQAHKAAAKSHFVYPPPGSPDAATAYHSVLELEELDGDIEQLADETAADLRDEFAGTLVLLGDRYFDVEGGGPFATDYYAQALLFDPDNPRALDRIVMTPGELAALRVRAEARDFSKAELEAAQMLAIFANDDEKEQEKQLATVYKKKKRRPSLTTSSHVEELLGQRATAVFPKIGKPLEAKPEPEPEPVVEVEPEPEPEPEPAVGAHTGKKIKADPDFEMGKVKERRKRDPAGAAELVKQAKSAMGKGNLSSAEALLHQALEKDRLSHVALFTLSELHFDRSSYRNAAKFASDAVRLSPKTGRYRIQLGDAYMKVMRYGEAREQYEKAKELGDGRAAERLKRLQSKLGG
jgi:serine/threonine protein kinase